MTPHEKTVSDAWKLADTAPRGATRKAAMACLTLTIEARHGMSCPEELGPTMRELNEILLSLDRIDCRGTFLTVCLRTLDLWATCLADTDLSNPCAELGRSWERAWAWQKEATALLELFWPPENHHLQG